MPDKKPAPKQKTYEQMMAEEKKKAQKLESLLMKFGGMTQAELTGLAKKDTEAAAFLKTMKDPAKEKKTTGPFSQGKVVKNPENPDPLSALPPKKGATVKFLEKEMTTTGNKK